jgi:hypothetical protein
MTLLSQVADARTFFSEYFYPVQEFSGIGTVEFTLCCALAVNKIAPSIVSGLHLSKARAFPGTKLVKYSHNFCCSIENGDGGNLPRAVHERQATSNDSWDFELKIK